MKIRMDKAGRFVMPKAVRDAMGFRPGDQLDAILRDGMLVFSPKGVELEVREADSGRPYLHASEPVAPLTTHEARAAKHRLRNPRARHAVNGE